MRRFIIGAFLVTLIASFTLVRGHARPDAFRIDIEVMPVDNQGKVLFRANLPGKNENGRRIIEKFAPYTFSVYDSSAVMLFQCYSKDEPVVIKASRYENGQLIGSVTSKWSTVLLTIENKDISITGL